MKTILLAIPALTLLSGCIVEDLNSALTSTTYTIHANQDAVNRSNDAILQNCDLINQANQALAENHRLLQSVK